jgi:hypothetical protein
MVKNSGFSLPMPAILLPPAHARVPDDNTIPDCRKPERQSAPFALSAGALYSLLWISADQFPVRGRSFARQLK